MNTTYDLIYQDGQNLLNAYKLDEESCTKYRSTLESTCSNLEERNKITQNLIHAIEQRNVREVDQLIKLGANLDGIEDKQTGNLINPLITAIKAGSMDAFVRLLKAGANINIQDHYGYTPLMYAIIYRNIDMFRLLIAFKSDIFTRNRMGQKALDLAIEYEHMYAENVLAHVEREFDRQNPIADTEEAEILKEFAGHLMKRCLVHYGTQMPLDDLRIIANARIKGEKAKNQAILLDFMDELIENAPISDGIILLREHTMKKIISKMTTAKEPEKNFSISPTSKD